MKYSIIILLMGFLLMSEAKLVFSQVPGLSGNLDIGDRVKISGTAFADPIVGTIVNFSDISIFVKTTSMIWELPVKTIENIDISMGRSRRPLQGLLIGAGSVGLTGGLIGAITYKECTETGFMSCFMAPTSPGDAFILGAVVGGTLGAVTGLIVGVLTFRDQWERLPVKISMGVSSIPAGSSYILPNLTVRLRLNGNR